MKLEYDDQIKVVGIGLSPWPRLGPDKWFKNYKILSLYGWDLRKRTKPEVHSLIDYIGKEPKLNRLNTQNLINNSSFQSLLEKYASGHCVLTYKPVAVPGALKKAKFIAVDKEIAGIFENKVAFRQLMNEEVRFPEYTILEFQHLLKTPQCYKSILNNKHEFVIQDENLSGGKGTFVVRSYEEYLRAIESLSKLSHGKRVVISRLLNEPKELSIQACVTKHGIFCGPLQQQLVGKKELANMDVVTGDKFCAIQIDKRTQNTSIHQEAVKLAQKIGKVLKEKNYRGIFGIDFLLDDSNDLYVLEVNPRITGATPLLTSLHEENTSIPFYLLHILELMGVDYKIVDESSRYDSSGSLMILHSQSNEITKIVSAPSSGTYKLEGQKLKKINDSIDLLKTKKDEFVIEEYIPRSMKIKPGNRLMVVKSLSTVIDGNELSSEAKKLVAVLYNNVKLSTVMEDNQLPTLGKAEYVEFIDLHVGKVPARIDTGAKSSSIWVSKATETKKGLSVVFFAPESKFYTGEKHYFSEYSKVYIKSSNGTREPRYRVHMSIRIGNKRLRSKFTLADRSKQSYPVLIGRRALLGKFLVDVKKGLKITGKPSDQGVSS